jgi:hypothetical protein
MSDMWATDEIVGLEPSNQLQRKSSGKSITHLASEKHMSDSSDGEQDEHICIKRLIDTVINLLLYIAEHCYMLVINIHCCNYVHVWD